MKKLFVLLMGLFAIMVTSISLKAQEITITLKPGWNWISYPNAEALEIGEALGDFVPTENDIIKSQHGSSTYRGGYWRGSITQFIPGNGYHYKSMSRENVDLVFGRASASMVTTSTPTNITTMSAMTGGMIMLPEGNHVFLRGVCWGTAPNPDIDGDHTTDGTGAGTFISLLENLIPDTTYYVRAYMVSDEGLNYGDEVSFTTFPLGIINGLFSVADSTQVYFSQGNLQYQASTNTWRFAENQWDYVGNNESGTVYENGVKCDNTLVSPTYEGWIDLFNWGTSGYNHGANCYQPWSISTTQNDYYAYGIETCSLFDHTGKADWGYNAISNGGEKENLWRTLSYDEWYYILYERETLSNIRFVKANVNDVNGIIILPDNWNDPNFMLNNSNDEGADYGQNIITLEDWNNVFQELGAIFLPCASSRYGTEMSVIGHGEYWSSTRKLDSDFAYNISIQGGYLGHSTGNGNLARSVRLVRPVQANISYSIEAVPNPVESGSIDGVGTYEYYAQVTLTANPNEGYTFYQWKENGNIVSTENPYSFVALFNRNLEACFLESSTYPLLYSFDDNALSATVIGIWDSQNVTDTLVIPETVMHNGETYTVTSIGQNAFDGTPISSITIPASMNYIGAGAFSNMNTLSSMTVLAGVPPTLGDCAFCETSTDFPVDVPCGSLEAYQNAEGWNMLSNIITQCSVLITVSANPSSGGTVSGGGLFEESETCTVTATANPSYIFTNWTENSEVVSTDATYSFTINGNRNLVANFVVSSSGDHGYVDLGLPSGLLWATCNIGADSPEEYGDYFAWGETLPKNNFQWSTYQYCNGSNNTLTKYCNDSVYGYNGFSDNLITLLQEDDPATANWGADWRIPTQEEWQELLDNTTCTWTTQNDVNGRLFTASNGNSLFIPTAGYRIENRLYYTNLNGYYWSSSLNLDTPYCAWILLFQSRNCNLVNYRGRHYGQSVRAVRSTQVNASYSIEAVPNPVESGTIDGVGTYEYYAQVTLTANPNEGYTFYQWKENGNVVSTENPYSFVALFNRNLEACFLESSTYPLLYSFDDNTLSATVIGIWDSQNVTDTLVIPETVMHNGETYTVTSIGQNAFDGTPISSITIPASVNYIGAGAFSNISTLSSMTVLAGVPPTLGDCAFCETSTDFPVDVPCGSLEAYQNAEGWNAFSNIITQCPALITVSANPSSGGTVSGGGTYQQGQSCMVSATNNTGYTFLGWTENDTVVSTETNYSFTVTSDRNLVAIFELCSYFITASANPETGGTIAGSGSYLYGESCTLTTMVNEGYTFINWTKGSDVVSTDATYSFTVTESGEYVANFELNSYEITTIANPEVGGVITGGGSYAHGSTCTLIANANENYTFNNWTENGIVVSTNTSYSFTVNGNRNLVANFVVPSSGDHGYVDLGLPSGLLWATCNIGANTPEEYGDYFAWGETLLKNNFQWSTYQYCNGSDNTLTKYCNDSVYGYNGFSDNLITLLQEDDPATANWGADWRIPTKEEWQELLDNTTCTWTTQNDVKGRLFTASNGNSLFIPAAGYRDNSSLFYTNLNGYYWSSSLNLDTPYCAWNLLFQSRNCNLINYRGRHYGQSVRAVRSTSPSQNDVPTGAINGKFTIDSEGNQVYFSQGNLQYIGSGSTPYWKFADNQWDCLGKKTGQNSNNQNIDRDLFGWGTSGWNNGNTNYQPWNTYNSSGSTYGPIGEYNLTGTFANADWGVYNSISNGGDQPNLWRTLTSEEWVYVFDTRETSSGIRYAKANVNNVNGVILLPDDWNASYHTLSNTNSIGVSYASNTISESEWNTMEQHGAVFLPAAGYRNGTSVYYTGSLGYYWSSSCYLSYYAYCVFFYNTSLSSQMDSGRAYGLSVRLVSPVE